MDPAEGIYELKLDAEERQKILKDLFNWEGEMRERDANYKNKTYATISKDLPPVRGTKSSLPNGHTSLPQASPSNTESARQPDDLSPLAKKQKSEAEKEKGNVFFKKGQLDNAAAAYSAAIGADRNNIACYANRALVYLKQKRFKEAEDDCTLALKLDPKYVKTLHRRGVARINLEDFVNAQSDLKRALELEPENKTIATELKKVEEELEKLDRMKNLPKPEVQKEDLNIVTDPGMGPNGDPVANVKLALEWKEKGNRFYEANDIEASINCYSNAMSLDPTVAIYYSNRGMAYLALGKYDEAEVDCSSAILMDPGHIKSYQRRAVARMKLGKFDEAVADLKQVLNVDPKNKIARQQLDEMLSAMKQQEEEGKISVTPVPVQVVSSSGDEARVISGFLSRFKPAELEHSAKEETLPVSPPPAKPQTPATKPLVTVVPSVPKNYTQFLKDWRKIRRDDDAKYLYIKQFKPENLRNIFKESLESEELSGIIHAMARDFIPRKEPVLPYLNALQGAKRFKSASMFLSEDDHAALNLLFNAAAENNESDPSFLLETREAWYMNK